MAEPLFASPQEVRAFEANVRTRAVGKAIHYSAIMGSTNDLGLAIARGGGVPGQVFVTDAQERGRGRRGRKWECAPGTGLLFSVVTRLHLSPRAFGWVPLTVGLACVDALTRAAQTARNPLRLILKWPNDLVLPAAGEPGWKKIGGILCETAMPAHSTTSALYAVVGVGVNVNQEAAELPTGTHAPATSMRLECGGPMDRKTVFKHILERLESRFDELESAEQRPGLMNEITARMGDWWTPQAELQVRAGPVEGGVGGEELTGAFEGLDEYGRLLLKLPSGESMPLADAEIVRVRGAAAELPRLDL